MSSESVWGDTPLAAPARPAEPQAAPEPVFPPQVAPTPVQPPETPVWAIEEPQVASEQPQAPAPQPETPQVAPTPTEAPPAVQPPPVAPMPMEAAPNVQQISQYPPTTREIGADGQVRVVVGQPQKFTQEQLSYSREKFNHLIGIIAAQGVSDIHFIGDSQVRVQKSGEVVTTEHTATNQEILHWVELFGKFRGGASELEHGRPGNIECMTQVGDYRLRMTFLREVNGYGMTARVVPGSPPRLTDSVFRDNPIPEKLIDLTMNSRGGGLIVAEGPTGSGKTTLIAALLNEVNENLARHVYTIEDPIEFLHKSQKSLMTQREIGEHADTIPAALRTSLRYKPQIILVGELLDLETVRGAIEAANKGHLVFATSHASSAEEGVSALINQFPGSEQKQVQVALSQALKAVVVQRLIPRIGGGMVPARELLLNNIAIAAKIRGGDFQQLSQAMKPTVGMWKFEHDIGKLVKAELVSVDDAYQFANDIKELEEQLAFIAREKGETFVPRDEKDAMGITIEEAS